MGSEPKLPTTEKYKVGVDVDLGSTVLSDSFHRAIKGQSSDMEALVKSLVGRDDVKLGQGRGLNSRYLPYRDQVNLNSSTNNFIGQTYFAPDNMPPSRPSDLTPELMRHLIALHESEHVKQFSRKKNSETGQVIGSSVKSTLIKKGQSSSALDRMIIGEVDADLAVVSHLKDMGRKDIGQFWLDTRTAVSFIKQFPIISNPRDLSFEAIKHNTSSIVSYYNEIGKVLDVGNFISEKNKLISKIHKEMGIEENDILKIIGDRPDLARKFLALDAGGKTARELRVRPQEIMHAVKTLLDKGALDEVQKWEAQNYMSAMKRLGYEPEPTYTYIDKIRETFEQDTALEKVGRDMGQINESGSEHTMKQK